MEARAFLPRAQEERGQPLLQCDTRGIKNRFMGRSFRQVSIKYYYYSRELSIRYLPWLSTSRPANQRQMPLLNSTLGGVPSRMAR